MPISCCTMEKLSAFLSVIGRRVLSKWVPFSSATGWDTTITGNGTELPPTWPWPPWTPGHEKRSLSDIFFCCSFYYLCRVFHKTWSLRFQLQNPGGELQESDYFRSLQLRSVEVTDKTPLCPVFTGVLGEIHTQVPIHTQQALYLWRHLRACPCFFKWVSSGWDY